MRVRSKLWLVACTAILAGVIAPVANATSPISAYKTAEAHWTKTFRWTIEKSVSPDSWTLATGQSGTSTYTVKVTKSLASEKVWVDGAVCVENVSQAPTENLKVVDRLQALVGDDVITLASVPLDMSINPVLDPGEKQCYPYSIEFTPVAGATYRNNARITVTNDPRDPGEEMGPNEKVDFTLPPPTVVNGSVNVDDTNGMSWLFSDSGQQTYTKTFRCDEDKGTHDNTATIRETGQSDDARVTVICTPPPSLGSCHETVNPAGNPAVGDNGYPDDPFGGDAVPGGKSTSPGTNGNGPINSDGFYLVGGLLFSDTTPIPYPGGGFVWPANTTVKYTERGNPQIKITSQIGGPNSVIEWHVQAPGDMYANAPMGAAGAIFCGVPPPPF